MKNRPLSSDFTCFFSIQEVDYTIVYANGERPLRANEGGSMGFNQGGGGFGGRPREMHKAVCAECKKECDVPFKPSGDRPVYCKDCFSKRKDSGR